MKASLPPLLAPRHLTRQIHVGTIAIGGGAPISVQSMTKTNTRDGRATLRQIHALAAVGADIVRVAVPDAEAAQALRAIVPRARVPLVADIHFDYRLAIAAAEAGVAGLRINPGNIGGAARVREVVRAARAHGLPIRVGVNAGSLEKDLLRRYGGATPEALVTSALRHVRLLERAGQDAIKISVKASDVARTVAAYRLLAQQTDYPLHLGVTEAGTQLAGAVRSCAALALLLAEGIGDTIRISLTAPPVYEVIVALELLRTLGLRPPGASVISCPTCGRTQINVAALARAIENRLGAWYRRKPQAPRPVVAVMGCMVNGPGEAREADIAIAGGRRRAALYVHGRHVKTVPEEEVVTAVMEAVQSWHPRPETQPGRAAG